jgi:hypothetical protein
MRGVHPSTSRGDGSSPAFKREREREAIRTGPNASHYIQFCPTTISNQVDTMKNVPLFGLAEEAFKVYIYPHLLDETDITKTIAFSDIVYH